MERPLPPNLQDAVDDFVDWRESRKTRYQFGVQPLFHYTAENGLIGIIKSDTFWFTHVEHLNDPSEFRLCHDMALSELKRAEERADPVVRSFFQGMLGGLAQGLYAFPKYIGSFSRHGDDLGQWRSYADNGQGFCLGISEQVLAESDLDENPLKNHIRVAIQYDATLAQQELREGVHRTIELLKRENVKREYEQNPATRKAFFRQLSVDLAHWIYFISILFKHPAYEAEGEVRLVLINAAARLQPHVRIRPRNGKIVPYIAWPFEPSLRQKGVLQLIRIGPAAPQNAENALIELLKSCGISSPPVEICRSQIPYRAV